MWEDSPEGYPQSQAYVWWNLHDEYDGAGGMPSRPASQRGIHQHGDGSPTRRRPGGGAPVLASTGTSLLSRAWLALMRRRK